MTAKYVQYGRLRYKILRFKDGRVRLEIVKRGMLDIAEIIGLNEQIELNDLDLSHNKIKNLNGLENLVNLRILRLSSNQISEISGLERLVNLEELYLNENQIKEINGLENLTNLRVLDLSYNEITDDKAIEELKANLPNLNSIQLGGNPCTLDIASLYQDRFLFKKTLEMRNSLSDSEFFDILGEVFKSNPEDYMKNLYGEVRKTVKKLYGDEKLNEMERYFIEKYCLYDGEQILFVFDGNLIQNAKMLKPFFIDSASFFLTNKRIIAQGKLKGPFHRYSSELGIYGYVIPIKNIYRLKRDSNSIRYRTILGDRVSGINLKIALGESQAKREEEINTIFKILSKDVNDIKDTIRVILERKKQKIKEFLLDLRISEEYQYLSNSEYVDIVEATYKLNPQFFMESIYRELKSWRFPSLNQKEENILKEEIRNRVETLIRESAISDGLH